MCWQTDISSCYKGPFYWIYGCKNGQLFSLSSLLMCLFYDKPLCHGSSTSISMAFMILITGHFSSLSPIELEIPENLMLLRLPYCSKWLNLCSRTSILLLEFAFSSWKFLIITSLRLITSSLRFENLFNNFVSKFPISTDVLFSSSFCGAFYKNSERISP